MTSEIITSLRNSYKSVFILVVVVVIAFVLRTYNLNLLPIFADEAIYVRWAQVMRAEPSLRFLPLTDGKQPLFMWIVIPFLKLFSDPLIAGRIVSSLTGVGTTIGVFVLSLLLFRSQKSALIASIMYAFSPFAVFFDRMALVDSMLSFFGVWTFVFACITAYKKRLDTAMLTGFFLGFALLTKSPALFFSLLIPTTLVLSDWDGNIRSKLLNLAKLLFLFIVVYVIGYGLYNILRLGPEFHQIGARNADYIFPISHLWTNPKDPFIFLIDRVREWLWILGPSVLIWIAIFGAVLNIKNHWRQVVLLSMWILFPILVQSEFAKVFTARYVFFVLPPIMVLSGSVFLEKKKVINILSILLIAIFLGHSLLINRLLLTDIEAAPLPRGERSGYLEEWTAGQGIRESAMYLREQSKGLSAGKRIVVGTEGYFGTLPDGLQIYLNDLKDIIVIGVGLNLKEVPPSLVESVKAGNKTYLLINSSRLLIKDPQKSGLKLIASYPKALRPDNIKEYRQFGPRDYLYLFEVENK